MIDDKELLELAAKAAGITGWQSKHGYWNMTDTDGQRRTCCSNWPNFDPSTGTKISPTFSDAVADLNWNPLDDDYDALRLAVKLRICFGPNFDEDTAVAFGREGRNICEPYGTDPYAATRRAIVRAAAAIGKDMP